MKQYKFPVRYCNFNPFLFNPIRAVVSDPNKWGNLLGFNIQHAITSQNGLLVFGRWDTDEPNAYVQLNLLESKLEIANEHEADRFDAMLKMLKIEL